MPINDLINTPLYWTSSRDLNTQVTSSSSMGMQTETPMREEVPTPEPSYFDGISLHAYERIYARTDNPETRLEYPSWDAQPISTRVSNTRSGRRDQQCPPPSADTAIQNMGRIAARIEESVCTFEMYAEGSFTSATTADIGTLCATINRLRNRLWKMHDKLSERRTELLSREAE